MARVHAAAGHVRLLRLEVHRHFPGRPEVQPHRHQHSQLLLYLTGRGRQQIASQTHPVGPGTLVRLPTGVRHAFHRISPRAPLCLAMDFTGQRLTPSVVQIPAVELRQVRDALRRLAYWVRDGARPGLRAHAEALSLLTHLLEIGQPPSRPDTIRALSTLVEHRLSEPGAWALPISVLARRCGYQPDYLNRRIKQETGLTLSQFRDRTRLQHARTALAAGEPVSRAAQAAGFEDVNYFTRWFRQQTGQPPALWRRNHPVITRNS